MEKWIIKQWDENKGKIEEYFRTAPQDNYGGYAAIVKKLLELVIVNSERGEEWNVSQMTVIDHGDYQGTKIFIVPESTYQPSAEDYIMTNTYYGSCSGCDTLEALRGIDDEPPTEEQLKGYMILCLHLVQKMRMLREKE